MASTFSPSLRIELIGDGDQSGIWGQTTNNNLGALIEQAIAGVVTITMIDTNYTMTNFNGVVDEARNQVLVLTGTNTAQRNLIAPLVEKTYTVKNTTTGGFAVQIIGSSGVGVVIPNGATVTVYCDGLNFFPLNTGAVGNFSVSGNLAVAGTTALSGALTYGGVALSNSVTGTGSMALSVSPAFTGTPTAPTAAPGTNTTQIASTAFATAAAIAAFPSGGIIMWSGSIASIPLGWLLCNGSSGTPDLRDRFIVGAGSTYAVNATGGFATYSLSTAQLPSHTHTGTTSSVDINHTHGVNIQSGGFSNDHIHGISDPGHSHAYEAIGNFDGIQTLANGSIPIGGVRQTAGAFTGITQTGGQNANHTHNVSGSTGAMSANNVHNHTFTTDATGSGAAIDNRPPYFALAYIMKA
jgi:microcystin-dependent protein